MIFVFSRHDGDLSALTLRQLMRAMEKALALPSGALKSHKGLIRRLLPQIIQVQQQLEANEEKREEARQQRSKEKTAGPRNKKKQAPHAPLAGEEAVTEVLPKGHWKRKKKRRIREDREEASEEEEREIEEEEEVECGLPRANETSPTKVASRPKGCQRAQRERMEFEEELQELNPNVILDFNQRTLRNH
ncbi:hypothetical protein QOT17_019202 [Balamuthia mandrillaris]